jgi:hypothetical protein
VPLILPCLGSHHLTPATTASIPPAPDLLLPVYHLPVDQPLTSLHGPPPPRPEDLLEHELAEPVTVTERSADGNLVTRNILRGLRIKSGIDIGPALGVIHNITGRVTYRGKVMNRAARISTTASVGQVLLLLLLLLLAGWLAAMSTLLLLELLQLS